MQRKGNFIKDDDDNFAVKTGMGQIFQGFKTKAEARRFGDELGTGTDGFTVISSPWYLDMEHSKGGEE
jgi:hypothetical protein